MDYDDEENGKKDDRRRRRPKNLLVLLVLVIVAIMLFHYGRTLTSSHKVCEVSLAEFLAEKEKGKPDREGAENTVMSEVVLEGNEITGKMKSGFLKNDTQYERIRATVPPAYLEHPDGFKQLYQHLPASKFHYSPPNVFFYQVVLPFIPWIILILMAWYFFFRQIRASGSPGNVLSFGKSRARFIAADKVKTTFSDVAGIDEAKEEVQEVIEFLKDPAKFTRLGGRIPRGILLVGPPGTGKTLLAKAIAGEAGVPFLSISGSDFVEMFVGVGASRVRDLFKQAKENSPCIIFLDEIDAVGRRRGTGLGGGHDEREQTLNQILVEMDGFDTDEGVIVMAATNRPDVLDPALLRPGRFDRQIVIDLPDVKGREEILKVHAKRVKLYSSVDLKRVARATPMFSGADLANLINEAAILATMKRKEAIEQADLEEARDKVLWGRQRKSRVMDEKEKKITAYHESGHTIVGALLLSEVEPIHKVTIIPRGVALGATMSLPDKDRYLTQRKYCMARLAMMFGGRVAEELFFDDISAGAKDDIHKATELARAMVCEWGMSEKMGPMSYTENEEHIFLGREIARSRHLSEETQQKIDLEVRKIVDESYAVAKDLISKNGVRLDAIAQMLLKYETLNGEEVNRILAGEDIELEKERERARERERDQRAARPQGTPGDGWKPMPGPQQA